jgi:hypothetical protein
MGPLPQYCTPDHLIPIELGKGKKKDGLGSALPK